MPTCAWIAVVNTRGRRAGVDTELSEDQKPPHRGVIGQLRAWGRWLVFPSQPRGMGIFWVLLVAVVVFDQWTKLWAVSALRGQAPKIIFEDFFWLRYAENTGAAFSMFAGKVSFLTWVSAVVALGMLIWAWRLRPAEQGMRLALGLVVGGAVGNLIDRVRLQYVIDFIDVHWMNLKHWPTFNIADSAVCVGMVLLLISSFLIPVPPRKGEEAPADKSPQAR